MASRNCRSIHHKYSIGFYHIDIIFIMYLHTFVFQLKGKSCWCFVVAAYLHLTAIKISCQRTHADSSDPQEINSIPFSITGMQFFEERGHML